MAYLRPKRQVNPAAWTDLLPRPSLPAPRPVAAKPMGLSPVQQVTAAQPQVYGAQAWNDRQGTQPVVPVQEPRAPAPQLGQAPAPVAGAQVNTVDPRQNQYAGDEYALNHYPAFMGGFPGLGALLQDAGFEQVQDAQGKYFWRMKQPYQEYDVGRVNAGMAQARDAMEPELLRQIASAEGGLAERGLERSSLEAGVQGGLRGQYVTALLRQRLQLIEQEKQRRYQKLLAVLSGASDLQRSMGVQQSNAGDDGGGIWDFVTAAAPVYGALKGGKK